MAKTFDSLFASPFYLSCAFPLKQAVIMKRYADYQHASISMSKDTDFIAAVNDAFRQYPIQHVIECGTFLGTGSTVVLAEAIKDTGRLSSLRSFYTLEVDYYFFRQAKKNLKRYPFIKPVWGMSVTKKEALAFIQNDEVLKNHQAIEDVFIDDVNDPVSFYTNEVNGNLSNTSSWERKKAVKKFGWQKPFFFFREGFLARKIPEIKNEFPLFLLDSAGGIGWLEFQKVVQLMGSHAYVMILDDTHHIKHFRSLRYIQQNQHFTILASNQQHGWAIAHYKPQ